MKDSREYHMVEKDKLGITPTLKKIPYLIRKMFSCEHCDWRKNNICPYGYKPGKPIYRGKGRNIHARPMDTTTRDGRVVAIDVHICRERKEYLKALYPGTKTVGVTAVEWLETYNATLANEEAATHKTRMDEILKQKFELLNETNEFDVEKLSEEDRKKLKRLERAYDKASQRFGKYVVIASSILGKSADRDKPKKIDLEVRNVTIRDFMDIASRADEPEEKKDAVDADFEELNKEEDEI